MGPARLQFYISAVIESGAGNAQIISGGGVAGIKLDALPQAVPWLLNAVAEDSFRGVFLVGLVAIELAGA
jgi:hypothetical protein